jgi:hypothetical protein
MSKQLAVSLLIIGMSMGSWVIAGEGVGNPTPGVPHDTLNIKVMKADSGPKECDSWAHRGSFGQVRQAENQAVRS